MTNRYQQPDGTPKNTGAILHDSVARVVIDDDRARSNYTIHVEHPDHNAGVGAFFRNSREMVVSGIRKHLDTFTDTEIHRVDVVDRAGLGLTEQELTPESFDRTGPFAPETPAVAIEP